MSHPRIDRWADYLRGVAGAERTGMREHLDSGCARCQRTVATLRRMVSLAETDRELVPPAEAMGIVKALSVEGLATSPAARSSIRLSVVFDSALEPLGIRSGSQGDRQMLLESDEYVLNLTLEPGSDSAGVVLAGQLHGRPAEPVAHRLARLMARERLVAWDLTNEQGQFELDSGQGLPLDLWIQVDPRHRIELRLER